MEIPVLWKRRNSAFWELGEVEVPSWEWIVEGWRGRGEASTWGSQLLRSTLASSPHR